MGKLVRFSDMMPTTTCAEKIQLSVIPMMTILHSDTLANVEGVRVDSIWRTSKTKTSSCETVANAASVISYVLPKPDWRKRERQAYN